jgi:uncharacterized membrane protein
MNIAHPYAPPSTLAPELPEPNQFSVQGALADAKDTLRRRPGALIGIICVGLTLPIVLDLVIGAVSGTSLPGVVAGLVAQLVLNTWFSIGVIRVSLAAARREEFSFGTLFSGADVLVPTLVSTLLVSAVVLLGTIALVIPGVIASLAFTFSSYLVIDRRADALESLSIGARLTRGQRLRILWLSTACGIAVLIGILALGIGALVALPLVQLAYAHAYVTVLGD